jgi:hypothetical protein
MKPYMVEIVEHHSIGLKLEKEDYMEIRKLMKLKKKLSKRRSL